MHAPIPTLPLLPPGQQQDYVAFKIHAYANEVDAIRKSLPATPTGPYPKPTTFAQQPKPIPHPNYARVSGQESPMEGAIGQGEGIPGAPTNLPDPAPPAPALVETVGGLTRIKSSILQSVNLLLGNLYLTLPGQSTPIYQVDGAWTLIAITAEQYKNSTGQYPPTGFDAYTQIKNRAPGYSALIDVDALAEVLNGKSIPIPIMGVKSQLAKQIIDDPQTNYAVLAGAGAGAGAAEEKKKDLTGKEILIAAGVGLAAGALSMNPLVGIAAGGVTAYALA